MIFWSLEFKIIVTQLIWAAICLIVDKIVRSGSKSS